jgi:hypothetical protein
VPSNSHDVSKNSVFGSITNFAQTPEKGCALSPRLGEAGVRPPEKDDGDKYTDNGGRGPIR